MSDIDLYLASGSPRRGEILSQLGVCYQRLSAEIDESRQGTESPRDYVQRLAVEKAAAGWRVLCASGMPLHPVLAADTTVALGDCILGKPTDAADAYAMLSQLSGQRHEVLTSVAIQQGERVELALSVSIVEFAPLSAEQIHAYIATGEPMDKAGSYGIQGLAGLFVRDLQGSFSGVMGLPVFETGQLCAAFGLHLPRREVNL